MTKRISDLNGWFEVKDNPLSKVGVFPYLGSTIGADEPDRIYNVYRPEEELSSPECLDSFKLVPLIDDHEMLGSSAEGLTPAEEYGVHGVIGESVKFENGTLMANLKIFSDRLAQLIQDGKKELSCGYRCVYEMVSGTFNGKPYDAVQRNIRGNHLALVSEGRMGPSVAVLDHFKFTLDSKELQKMTDKKVDDKGGAPTLESLDARLTALDTAIAKIAKAVTAKDENLVNPNDKGTAIDEEEEMKKKEAADKAAKDAAEEEEKKKKEAEDKKGMDAKLAQALDKISALEKNGMKALMGEIAKRDALASSLSNHIGAFDHADKTYDEVAQYGVEKLGIKCDKGQEAAVLNGFLHNRTTDSGHVTLDSKVAGGASEVDAYINGK
jgi:hypothetical protein